MFRVNQSEVRAEVSVVGVSGYYVLACALGSFLGPTLAGVMFESMGFQKSLVLLWVCYTCMVSRCCTINIYHKHYLQGHIHVNSVSTENPMLLVTVHRAPHGIVIPEEKSK